MAIKTKLSIFIFLFFLINIAICREETDPELKTCKHQCHQQRQYDEHDKRICMKECDEYHEMKQEREKHKEDKDDEKEVENPYVFEYKDFDTILDTEDGRISVLNMFDQKSKLLRNVENYGLAVLEAKAHAFVSPHHFDSEVIFFNMKGRGIIGLVEQDNTERFNLEAGDIIRVPAGTPIYLVNRDENEKLFIAALHMPSSPGSAPLNFEAFFGPAGRNPESVLTAFSSKVLQAAFKTSKGKLESVLEEQKKERIFKIRKEDVHGMAPKKSIWPFGGQFNGPFNIFSNKPSFSNQFGSLFEIGPSESKSGLEGLNVMLSFANITKGSMSTIYYNTNANKIAFVVDGEGYFEMACPHYMSSKHRKSSSAYHKMNARLRPGMVFVVPAGHPFVTIASKNNNLKIVCFEVNAERNKKLAFAGKKNIVVALDKTAKKLSFDSSPEKVDEIFKRDEEFFFSYDVDEESKEDRGHADV
ncbi:vicilin-like protein antimicrobial peptides 2-1-like protein [Trifolium pratense]|uniref:Vicilin-like protein antimicrobial peptides 2-1-like protein n=1 Tax=Trifolium pratense TaxID=57577 RepID=A0A2K3L0Z1_TRIPR|nr:vicilin-like protein antimicrobial peptides 2-1-like protein [Trifolium pratense]